MTNIELVEFDSVSQNDTELFAQRLGGRLRGGEVIELIGDVGAGKTTFVRGFAKGAGSADRVSSPTFTVSNVYQAKKFEIHHYDFYRLEDYVVIENELAEVVSDNHNVAILEWAQAVDRAIPDNHVRIVINVTGEDTRQIRMELNPDYTYVKDAE